MLPRTGRTFTGAFGFTPGMVPAPASAPFTTWADPRTPATIEPASRTSANHLLRIAHRLQFLAILRIHRLGAAARGIERNLVVVAELVEIGIGARQQMRNHAARTIDLRHHAARIRRHLLMQIELVIRPADERLRPTHPLRDQ